MPSGIYQRSEKEKQRLKHHFDLTRYIKPITSNVVNLNKLRTKKDKCVKCGSKKFLHLHHVIPAQYTTDGKWNYKSGDHSDKNIQVLCASCHLKLHYALGRPKNTHIDPITKRFLPK